MKFKKEYQFLCDVPVWQVRHAGCTIALLRADLLQGGVKYAIGSGLLRNALKNGDVNGSTKALVVHGAGNTVTAVKGAVDIMNLGLRVIAVVYNETPEHTRARLRDLGIEVTAESPRAAGQMGRSHAAVELCASQDGFVQIEQHEQPLIVEIQRRTLGRRLAEEVTPDYLLAGVGTGGTLFGLAAALRECNPKLRVTGLEGVGSTLTLWHAYLQAKADFGSRHGAITEALQAYERAGMVVSLDANPSRLENDWFRIGIDFPPHQSGVLGIDGLGVGNPSNLITGRMRDIDDVEIITDDQAEQGVRMLEANGIRAVESAGANFFAACRLAEQCRDVGETATIATVVTAARE